MSYDDLNIKNYNLIDESNKVKANYDLSNKETYFELYFSTDRRLAIVGCLDNNYAVWCSVSQLDDYELNKAVFDYVANTTFDTYSHEYLAFDKTLLSEMKSWHKCMISRSNLDQMIWQTPFGHYYGHDAKNNGSFFSRDLRLYFEEQINLCHFRTYSGNYISVLEDYSHLLNKQDDFRYYEKVKPLISLLTKESYLKLCPDEKMRAKYIECMNKAGDLYNWYMTNVR